MQTSTDRAKMDSEVSHFAAYSLYTHVMMLTLAQSLGLTLQGYMWTFLGPD